MNPVAIRLLNQQLIVPQFKTPTEVVNHMGALGGGPFLLVPNLDSLEICSQVHKFTNSENESAQEGKINDKEYLFI